MTSPDRLLAWCAGGLLAALILAVGINPLTNNDIWIHLTTGRLIFERGSLPRVDEYSFTRAGAPYVTHEWLAQVLFHVVHHLAGVTGLILLKPAALAATAFLVARTCRSIGAGPVAAFWASTLAVASMTSHLFVRPHLFSFVMLAASSLLLARLREGRRGALARLALLQIAWANLHGGFVLGIALALLAGAWIAAAAAALASLLNPHGAALYRFVLIFADPVLRSRIREWSGPFEAPFFGSLHFWIYLGILALAAAALAHHLRRRRWGSAATLAGFALLSILSKRNASLLGVAAAPWIALALTETLGAPARHARTPSRAERRPAPAMALSCLAAALLAGAAALFGVPHESGRARRPGLGLGENLPVAAVDYLQGAGVEGNALDSMGFGGYLIWRAWPATRVFVDSRLDVYGGPFIEKLSLAMADPSRMRDLIRAHRIDYAVISYRLEEAAGAAGALGSDPGWALVWFDDVAMVYLPRVARWESLIARDAYRVADPYRFLSGRIDFGGEPAAGLAEADRALARAPSCLVARLMRGTALQRLGRHREAVAALEEAGARLPPDAGGGDLLLGLLGTSYMALGEDAKAEAAFRDLARMAPGSAYARRMLQEIEARRKRGN